MSVPAGKSKTANEPHPSGDNRFKMLDASMKRQRYQPDALIEVLHTAQGLFGHLDPGLMFYIARGLKVPPSRVYGVSTFYHFFTFKPKGEHTCVVCMGTACYVKGADALVHAVTAEAGINPGQTSPDGKLSVETARCLGACGLAPVVIYDGEVSGNVNPDSLRNRVKGWFARGSE
jgi:bidirectional [NiFe] hydrogenase diaphorase subunit